MHLNSLSKAERLCSKTLFEELLSSTCSFIKFPFRIVVKESARPGEYPARIAISVSKKKFRHAVKRNRIKRLTREAFRCNKSLLYDSLPAGKTLDILFIYIDKREGEYAAVEKAMQNALRKLTVQFCEQTGDHA